MVKAGPKGRRLKGFGILVLGALAGGGCAETTIMPNPALLTQAPPYRYTDADWAEVLRDHVRDGLVDYEGLSRNRAPLERYYALLSVTGPTRTPEQFISRAQATAYWVNAHNALVLCAVVHRYPLTTMYDLSLPRLRHEYKFKVDGRVRKLAAIEAEILTASNGDIRALLATSGAAMGTPALAGEPIRPETLDRQLAAAAARALDNPNVLRIDHANGSILVWQLILQRRSEFEEFWRKRRRVRSAYLFNVLLELASRERRHALQGAVGYTLRQIPFDRTLNRWSRRRGLPLVP